ncbi:ATP-binding protein [bacterium]|nr:ATP-binding protein [bacterium]MCB2201893.1 ATP-binding protein [bacterium]
MDALRYSDVFVPGGFPRLTYNPRMELQLETSIQQVTENLCKLVPVTGHTKSGKTVLVRSILPREEAIWVDGGGVGAEEDFWTTIIGQLDLFQETESTNETESTGELSATGKAGTNVFVAKVEGEIGGAFSTSDRTAKTKARSVSSRVTALSGLRDAERALVIDDFHYLPRALQGDLIRALKPLIFDGLPVVIIAIPHRRYDAVKVEKEMTGRILPITIPSWGADELMFIPDTGFPLLRGKLSTELSRRLANESIGSPHLMQEFCRAICRLNSTPSDFNGRSADPSEEQMENVFRDTAETIGRPIFEKLARGPRQRSDRISRQLKSGETVDIYGLVLHALAHLRPGLETLEYEVLRVALREVSANDPPQLHEVSRVLKHMSDIAATDESSTPVIDFDEEEKRLHVTDPFFAYYLRWGRLEN